MSNRYSSVHVMFIRKVNVDLFIYNPPNNFCGLSLDKTDHVIQNRTMVIRRYPSSDFISTEERPRHEQVFKLNFKRSWKTKKILFAEASEGEIKRLVNNSVQRNTKKSTKYAGTIYVRSP